MPIIIILLLIGVISLTLVLTLTEIPENILLKSFYKNLYGIEVKRKTIKSLKQERLTLFIDWIIENEAFSIVYLEEFLSYRGMKILNREAKSRGYKNLEAMLQQERDRRKECQT
jgi:hypothetical protein